MRIVAGAFRSRKLKGPGKLRIRPTSDRLRETLFNILGPAVQDSLFLDLYAGTGAVGIEAISRGAREVIFVESHPQAARLIRENLGALGVRGPGEVMEADVERALDRVAARHLIADFIFLDPPYASPARVPAPWRAREYPAALDYLDESRLIAAQGLVIAEHPAKQELPDRLSRLERMRLLVQGDSALSFYRLAAAA